MKISWAVVSSFKYQKSTREWRGKTRCGNAKSRTQRTATAGQFCSCHYRNAIYSTLPETPKSNKYFPRSCQASIKTTLPVTSATALPNLSLAHSSGRHTMNRFWGLLISSLLFRNASLIRRSTMSQRLLRLSTLWCQIPTNTVWRVYWKIFFLFISEAEKCIFRVGVAWRFLNFSCPRKNAGDLRSGIFTRILFTEVRGKKAKEQDEMESGAP